MASHSSSNGGSFSTKFIVEVPPGRLGLRLVDSLKGGTMISMVNKDSPLAGSLERGDQLISINGIDVHEKSVTDISAILQNQSTMGKKITVARNATEINSSHSNEVLNNTQLGSTHAASTSKNQQAGINHIPRKENHHHSSSKHREKHHSRSYSSYKKNKFDLIVDNVDDDAAPVPPEMKYDESLEKICDFPRKRDHHHSSSKRHGTHHSSGSKETKNRNIDLIHDDPDEDVAPVPAAMEFDEPLDKRGAGKPHHGHRVPPVELNYSEDAPPAPCSTTHDDSIEKAKSKSSRCTERTYTNSTSQSSARHKPPSCLEVPFTGDEISTISSSTFENAPSGIPYGRPVSTSGSYHRRETAQQQMPADSDDNVEEGRRESSISDASEDILAEAQEVYDAELVSPEKAGSPNIVVNVHSQSGEPSNKTWGRKWYENKCFIGSIVLVVLIVVGVITGVAVSLQKENDNGNQGSTILVQTGEDNIDITNAITLMIPPTDALSETYYCGPDWNSVNEDCSSATPCPSGSDSDCHGFDEYCIPFTNCGKTFEFVSNPSVLGGGPNVYDVMSTFYCGSNAMVAEQDCGLPCPNGPSDCEGEDQGCFAFTTCNAEVSPETFVEVTEEASTYLSDATTGSSEIATTVHPTSSQLKPVTTLTEEEAAPPPPPTTTVATRSTTATSLSTAISSSVGPTVDLSPYDDTATATNTQIVTTSTASSIISSTTVVDFTQSTATDMSVASQRDSGHDSCATAATITDLPAVRTGTTLTATADFESSLQETCGMSLDSRGVWYSFSTIKKTVVRLEYELYSKGLGDSALSVFEGTCDDGSRNCIEHIRSNDQASSWDAYNDVLFHEFLAEVGVNYMFLLSGENANTIGEYKLKVTGHPVPSNDDCPAAVEVTSFPARLKGSLIGATPDFDEITINTACGNNLYTRGVWYKLVVDQAPGAVIQLEYQLNSLATGKSELTVYTGSCEKLECWERTEGNASPLSENRYNDLVQYEFHAEQDAVFWFLLSGEFWYTAAEYELKVTKHDVPDNDSCQGAVMFNNTPGHQFVDLGSNIGATPDFDDASFAALECGIFWYSRGVWYRFEGHGAIVRFEYQLNSVYAGNSIMAIFTGDCASLECVASIEAADSKSYFNDLAVYEMIAEDGVTYSILLTGEFFTAAGYFSFSVLEYEIPQNDACQGATMIETFPFITTGSSNSGATPDFNLFNEQCGGLSESRGLWYKLDGNNKVTTIYFYFFELPQNTYSQLSIFSGPCSVPVCEGDFGREGWAYFVAEEGKTYRLYLSGNSFSAHGDFGLEVSQIDPPSNDSCDTSIPIAETPHTNEGDLAGATPDFSDIDTNCGNGWSGIWFEFIGDGKTYSLTLNTIVADSYFKCEVTLFKGPCGRLKCVTTKEGSGENAAVSIEALPTAAGVKYLIHVAANDVSYDNIPYQLSITELV